MWTRRSRQSGTSTSKKSPKTENKDSKNADDVSDDSNNEKRSERRDSKNGSSRSKQEKRYTGSSDSDDGIYRIDVPSFSGKRSENIEEWLFVVETQLKLRRCVTLLNIHLIMMLGAFCYFSFRC